MKRAGDLDFGKPRLSKKTVQAIGFTFVRLVALVTVLPILGIVVYIVIKGGATISWEFLTAMPGRRHPASHRWYLLPDARHCDFFNSAGIGRGHLSIGICR